MFKVHQGIAPDVISDLFCVAEHNATRTGNRFVCKRNKSVFFGEMSLSSFGPIVWNDMVPKSLKSC